MRQNDCRQLVSAYPANSGVRFRVGGGGRGSVSDKQCLSPHTGTQAQGCMPEGWGWGGGEGGRVVYLTNSVSLHKGTGAEFQAAGVGGVGGAATPTASHIQSRLPRS